MYHAVYILNVEEETFETIKYPWNSPDREFGVVDFKTGMESLIEKVIPEKRKAFFELYGLLKLKEAMKDGPDKIYHEFQMEGLDGYIWMSVTAISLNSNRIVLLLQNIDQRVRVDKRNRHISNITGMIFRDYCEHIYEISLSTGQCFYFTTDEFNFYRKSIGKIEDNID